MSGQPTTCIRLPTDEQRYARALSRRLPGCPRPEVGSVAHALRWMLHQYAKRERVPLGKAEKYPRHG